MNGAFRNAKARNCFEISINRKHRNARLLERCMGNPKVRMMYGVIIENIKQRIINTNNGWNRIIDFGGSFVEEWKSENLVTVQSIGCLEEGFADSVNRYICAKLSEDERRRLGLTELMVVYVKFL